MQAARLFFNSFKNQVFISLLQMENEFNVKFGWKPWDMSWSHLQGCLDLKLIETKIQVATNNRLQFSVNFKYFLLVYHQITVAPENNFLKFRVSKSCFTFLTFPLYLFTTFISLLNRRFLISLLSCFRRPSNTLLRKLLLSCHQIPSRCICHQLRYHNLIPTKIPSTKMKKQWTLAFSSIV